VHWLAHIDTTAAALVDRELDPDLAEVRGAAGSPIELRLRIDDWLPGSGSRSVSPATSGFC
jgi:hypothetical protein